MSRTITLGPEQEVLLQRLLHSGRFPDEAAAISAALEMLEGEPDPLAGWSIEDLRRAVQAGIDSGPGVPIDEAFVELRQMLAERFGPDPRK